MFGFGKKKENKVAENITEKDFEVYVDLSELVETGTFEVPLHLQLSEKASKMENVEFSLKNDTVTLTLEPKITALVPVKTNISGGGPANPISKNKTPNRNDVCPCGSGKKYKKCCGMNNGGNE